MVKVISVFNQAGGVGKTTVVQNLGERLAARGNRVLLFDFDPQASLTLFCGFDPTGLEKTPREALLEDAPLQIEPYRENLDLVATNILLADCEQELFTEIKREERLKDALAPVRRKYDFILIDCPPSFGLLLLNALTASTHVLVPIETQFKSFMGVNSLLRTVGSVQSRLNKNLRIAGIFPTIHKNRRHNNAVLAAIREQLTEVAPIFPPLPEASVFAEASERGLALAEYTRAKKYQHLIELFDQIAEAMEEL